MFSLIKQMFIVLLSISESLAHESCMDKPTLIDFHPFMISLDKWSGSCNVLSPKTCVSKETKDISIKAFNIITNKN